MITFTCNKKGCANEKVVYDFLGNPEIAECGGCKSILVGQDLRDDPKIVARKDTLKQTKKQAEIASNEIATELVEESE